MNADSVIIALKDSVLYIKAMNWLAYVAYHRLQADGILNCCVARGLINVLWSLTQLINSCVYVYPTPPED
jgi:hypothetical protein